MIDTLKCLVELVLSTLRDSEIDLLDGNDQPLSRRQNEEDNLKLSVEMRVVFSTEGRLNLLEELFQL